MAKKANSAGRLFLICCALTLWTVFASSQAVLAAVPEPQPGSGDNVRHGVKGQQNVESRDYWTPERMKEAKPVEEKLDGKEWMHLQQHARPVRNASARAEQVPSNNYANFPYSAIGKVFFTDQNTGSDYVCSGTAVVSLNKSVVDTAGHCVMEGGSSDNFYMNWMFCPQRFEGNCPKGMWYASELFTTRQWADEGAFGRDLGFAVVEKQNDKLLLDVVKGVKMITGLSANQNYTALGYPAASPFDGEHLMQCKSRTATRDTMQRPPAIGINCDMTGGSSGGGWLIQRNNTWYLNAHTSYGITFLPGVLYSPYFDRFVGDFFREVEGTELA